MKRQPKTAANPGLIVLLGMIVALTPMPAHAYIGPAYALLVYLLGPVAAFFAVLAMVLFHPVRAVLRKRKQKAAQGRPADPKRAEKQAG